MTYFLIVYNQRLGELVEMRAFGEAERHAAEKERFMIELLNAGRPEIEVALMGADSEEALRRTHGRYFKTVGELAAGF